jgi:tRNA(Ile)-lysidine synthase
MTNSKSSRLTKPRLTAFARNLLEEWRRLELPVAEVAVVVAVSGGADSTALLLALDELIKMEKLRLELTVAHLDHRLRNESRKDAEWVGQLAEDLGYETVVGSANLKRGAVSQLKTLGRAGARTKTKAKTPGGNLEQAARKARYTFLRRTAAKQQSNLVLTAHTLDDQAETILMRLLRGSAAEGLSGTPAVRELERGSPVKLVRPLLSWARRGDTEDYCRHRQIDFRFDAMNDDEGFSRVRVRKQLLPLMKSFNNRVVEALSRTAALLNEDAVALSDEAGRVLDLAAAGTGKNGGTKSPALSVEVLRQAPPAVRRRALREWILRARGDLSRVEMVHLVGIEKLLQGDRGGRVAELPGGTEVTRRRGLLELSRKKRLKKTTAASKIHRGHSPQSHRRK